MTSKPDNEREIYTPTRLNREVRFHLEQGFPGIWVEGEISNLFRAGSGHSYFTLKDATAQLKCALFRNRNPYGRVQLENGQQVLVRGRLSLYEPRGEYQLIAEHVEDSGEGELRRQFEALKQKLVAEGLFAAERKRALPQFPQTIAVVTSPGGAAIRDVISVLDRRFPSVRLVVVPSAVQGE
ncbi:MAG: exodeoxyribonuclease VII large subunit, partial [Xanthomonadales bacterium]|nr:exodeoxyribonuclease VII large subunit [Xanthomonadales bacterium]